MLTIGSTTLILINQRRDDGESTLVTLSRNPDEVLIARLVAHLGESKLERRLQAATALAFLGPVASAAAPDLVTALHDDAPAVRRMAIIALGEIGVEAGILLPHLTSLLKDEHEMVVRRAVLGLGSLGHAATSAASLLAELLDDTRPVVRRHAAAALGEIAPRNEKVISRLLECLNNQDMKMRVLARIAIQRIGAGAIPHLLAALEHGDPEMRRSAVLLLGRLCSTQTASKCVENLADDPDPAVRDVVAMVASRGR